MTKEELSKIVYEALNGHVFNTNERADKLRKALEEAYKADDYPVLVGLEYSWKMLESDYEIIDRKEHPGETPLGSFTSNVDMGFYPPPEIMLAISSCFERYQNSGGDISLDEAFFGSKHKKRNSPPYFQRKKYKYFVFHSLWVAGPRRKVNDKLTSLEKLAEDYLDDLLGEPGWRDSIDIDSFLRGYRRWLLEMKTSNSRKD